MCINIYIERLARLPEAENLGGSRAGCFRLRREGRARERDGKKRKGGRSGRRNVNPVAVVARHERGGEGTMLKFPIF